MEYALNKLIILEKLTDNILRESKSFYVFCDSLPTTNKGLNVFIITKDDTVYALGSNRRGCLGFGHRNCVDNPEPVSELCNKEIIDFSYSFNYMIARSRSGEIYSWGREIQNVKQSHTNKVVFTKPRMMNLTNITEVCSGKNFSILSNQSEIFIYTEIHRSYSSYYNPYEFKKLLKLENENILQVSCGEDHSIFLTDKGNVFTWGDNETNNTVIGRFFEIFRSTGRRYNKYEPRLVRIEKNDNSFEKFAKIACGRNHSLLLTFDGYIYTSGKNHCGQLGNRNMRTQSTFQKINKRVKFIDVIANFCNDISIALSIQGVYYIWGECGTRNVSIPEKTHLESPFSIFAEYFQITHKTMYISIDKNQLESGSLQNCKYKKEFNEFFIIGIGSSGVVCKSQWICDYKNYAIKKIPIFQKYSNKLIKELEIMSKLKCDYVVHCIAFWIEKNYMDVNDLRESNDISLPYGHPFLDVSKPSLMHIQMELCAGTLKQFIKRLNDDVEPFSYKRWPYIKYYIACELLTELLECIDYLHKLNPPIIHRDLKPTNILLTNGKSGRLIKLSDFGSVTIHEFDEQSHTQGVGTFKYMAPEIIMSRKYDTKADIYSLGIIIQELFEIYNIKLLNMSNMHDNKLKNLQILSNKSTSLDKTARPECADMLAEKSSWALTLDDLKGSDEILDFSITYARICEDKKDFFSMVIFEELKLLKKLRNELKNSKKPLITHCITSVESSLDMKFDERKLYPVEIEQSLELSEQLNLNIPEYSRQNDIRYIDNYFEKEKYEKDFKELNIISHGSYSIVCKSICKNDGISYAVKKIPFNHNYQFIGKMIRDCEVIRTLNKTFVVDYKSFWIENNYMKNIARYDDMMKSNRLSSGHGLFDENNDRLLHIQMELCDKTLKEIIKQVNNELNQKTLGDLKLIGYFIASQLLIEILECVNYLHKREPPIIHRDLKPTNILITNGENGRFIKIADFDLATFHIFDEMSHTQASGTIKYMAPEVIMTRKYDTKADMYSLGIIVSELFNIDLNSPIYMDNENDLSISDDFKQQFLNTLENVRKMISIEPASRPDCEKLLFEKQYWALSLNDLKNKYNFNNEIKGKEESFYCKFIRIKVKHDNQVEHFNEILAKNLDLSKQNSSKVEETKLKKNEKSFEYTFTEREKILRKKLIEIGRKYYREEMNKCYQNTLFIAYESLKKIHEKIVKNALAKYESIRENMSYDKYENIMRNSLFAVFDEIKQKNDANTPTLKAIGIDLGITNSCVAYYQPMKPNGKVDVIKNDLGEYTTPSVVTFNNSGQVIVGNKAKTEDCRNTVFFVKRLIGSKYKDEIIHNDMKLWPFKVIDDGNDNPTINIKVNGLDITYTPEEISAKILEKMREIATKKLGYKVRNAVIAVPAYFTEAQKQTTIKAGAIAGINVLKIINEPTAAAIAYQFNSKDDMESKKVLIYDFGGGTLDVSILVIDKGKIEVKAYERDNHLGGDDIDNNIIEYCLKEFYDKTGQQVDKCSEEGRLALTRLNSICKEKKCQLSSLDSVFISIHAFIGMYDLKVELTRKKFEDLNYYLFLKSMNCVKDVLNKAKLSHRDIDDIVLVSGTTRIPCLRRMLSDLFDGKQLSCAINPENVVVVGAAILAAIVNGVEAQNLGYLKIIDVVPISLGVKTNNGFMSNIISSNTKIPTKHTKQYTTSFDHQREILIEVYEGEEVMAVDNNLLGIFKLQNIPSAPKGTLLIDVSFEINEDGKLDVKAKISGNDEEEGILGIKLTDIELQNLIQK